MEGVEREERELIVVDMQTNYVSIDIMQCPSTCKNI